MKRLLVCLISFLVGFIVSWFFLDFILPEPTVTPEPEQPKYTVSEMMIADLERFSLYRDTPTVLHVPTPTEPETPPVRYELTDSERELVELVVMAESGNQPYIGQMAVAQCLLNDSERSGIRPTEAVVEYQYTSERVEPSESVRNAVAAVFDGGEVVTEETILWFYAPKYVDGTPWHETQRHVLTINDHKFFAERGDADADH